MSQIGKSPKLKFMVLIMTDHQENTLNKHRKQHNRGKRIERKIRGKGLRDQRPQTTMF